FVLHLYALPPAVVAVPSQGQAVMEGATLLLNGLRHVRRAALHAERRVAIRMGVTPFLSVTLVPRLLWTLRKQGGEVSVSLREGRGPQMFELFKSGELDALLVAVSA